jgi:hypothetical protein
MTTASLERRYLARSRHRIVMPLTQSREQGVI